MNRFPYDDSDRNRKTDSMFNSVFNDGTPAARVNASGGTAGGIPAGGQVGVINSGM